MTDLKPEVDEEEISRTLEVLAELLSCSQCGQKFATNPCGPTHALLQHDPRRHRLLAPLLEAERLEVMAREAATRFRVEVACEGYAHLTDGDVPHDMDAASYQGGAAEAAKEILAAFNGSGSGSR